MSSVISQKGPFALTHCIKNLVLSNKCVALGCICVCVCDINHYFVNLISAPNILNCYFDCWCCIL